MIHDQGIRNALIFMVIIGVLTVIFVAIADGSEGATYGVSFDTNEGTHILSPEHDSDGVRTLNLTVTNEGDSQDTFNFEFSEDSSTQKYKKWFTIPSSITLDPDEQKEVSIEIRVPPYKTDNDAVADGELKNITFIVYSKGARDHGVEVEGTTTDDYLCHVDIREYRYAFFTDITPSEISLGEDETAIVNVTIKNEGNGIEQYTFIKDGWDGGGQYTSWYDFNVSSVDLSPMESVQVSIYVDPESDAPPGLYDLEFHATSETTYVTDQESFRIVIEETYGGHFISATNRSSDPGKTVRIDVNVRNTGNAQHEFRMATPQMPDGWDNPTWSSGDTKSIDADSSGTFTLEIDIPDDYTKAKAGVYQFQVDGYYEDEGGSETKFAKSINFSLTVNTVYGVEVSADEYQHEADPGDQVTFQIKIRNSGNINETYQLSVLKAGAFKDAKPWTTIIGADPGNRISIPIGETQYLDIQVDVPEFTEENDEAEAGLFGVKIKAESTNESSENGEQVFELEVEEFYAVKLWSPVPGKNQTLTECECNDTTMTFTLYVRNLGNTIDDILVNVPNSELLGEKSNWSVKFGTEPSKVLRLSSLAQQSLTLTLTVDNNTDPGSYTFRVRAESQGDTVVYVYTTIFVNLTKAPVAIIDSSFHDPVVRGQTVYFIGTSPEYSVIARYLWHSNIDGELYNGTSDNFTLSNLSLGNHTISLSVQDTNGVWSTEVSTPITIHSRPIAIIDLISPDPAFEGETVSFEGHGTDDGFIARYVWRSSIDDEIYEGSESSFTHFDLSVGNHTIYFKVMDNNWIWSEEATLNLTVEDVNLLITIDDPSEGDTVNGVIQISGDVYPLSSEADSQILVRIDNGSWKESTSKGWFLNTCFWLLDWNSLTVENGEHTISAKAFDGENWSNIAQVTVTVENQDSADLIPIPQWEVGDTWRWSYTVEVEGTTSSMTVTEEIQARDLEVTDNWTALEEPCYKLVAKTLIFGQAISTSTVYLSMETFEILVEDFQGEGMPLFLYGFMTGIDWPLIVTDGGPYQWTDAGNITVDAGTYACYVFNGTSGPIYYSPEVKHIVKAEMGEISFELKKVGTDGDPESDNDDDEFFLVEKIGPLPLIGYLSILLLIGIVLAAGTSGRSGKSNSGLTPASPSSLSPPTIPPSPPSGQSPPITQPSVQNQPMQPSYPPKTTPPPTPPLVSGLWTCPACGNRSKEKFAFCMKCGSKR